MPCLAADKGKSKGKKANESAPGGASASQPAAARAKRWADGLEAPCAGVRNFAPQGFEVKLDLEEAIARFGHNSAHIARIMDTGRAKASISPTPLATVHAAAIYAYEPSTFC